MLAYLLCFHFFFVITLFFVVWICRPCLLFLHLNHNYKNLDWHCYGCDVEISKLGWPTCEPLPPFGLFGACTAIWILSRLWQKGVFSFVYGISADYLGGLGLVRFALNYSLLSVLAVIGYRAVNYFFSWSSRVCLFLLSFLSLSLLRISRF